MSAHEVERLSAYIDRELSPAERGAVETHLRDCFECAGRLAELAAVDEAVRELSVDPPAGYFDAFPGRVRGRLGSASRRRPGHAAPWLLAAAAGLLLAVLTPSVLRNARPASSVAPHPEVPLAAAPPAQGREAASEQQPRVAESFDEVSAPRDAARPKPRAGAAPGAERKLGPTPAATPAASPARAKGLVDQPAPLSSSDLRKDRPPEAGAERDEVRQRKAAERGYVEEQPAPKAPPVTTASPPAGGSAPQKADEFAAAPPEPSKAERAANAEPAGRGGAAATGAIARQGGRRAQAEAVTVTGAVAPEGGRLSMAQERFEGLLERSYTDAAGARSLREAWRAFASDYPEGAGADEARVRMVETGAAAYRLGADPQDLALARRDGEAYLRRPSAPQAKRVREVLGSLE